MNQEKIQVLAQLNEMIDQTKGKVFMGMVHQMYGPLRGLNFILTNAQAEDIMNSIDEQAIEMEPEFQLKLAEEIKDGNTGLSPRLMVLPEDLIKEAENPPVEVKNIADGRKEILNVLQMTHKLQEKDIHFFRVGIV